MHSTRSSEAGPGLLTGSKRRGRTRLVLGVVAALLVSGGLFSVTASQLESEVVVARVREASLGWVSLSFVVAVVLLLVRSGRMLILAPGLPFMEVVAATSLQSFLMRVTPMRL